MEYFYIMTLKARGESITDSGISTCHKTYTQEDIYNSIIENMCDRQEIEKSKAITLFYYIEVNKNE